MFLRQFVVVLTPEKLFELRANSAVGSAPVVSVVSFQEVPHFNLVVDGSRMESCLTVVVSGVGVRIVVY